MGSPVRQPLMKVVETSLVGVLVLEPKVFADARGFFVEGYNEKLMADSGVPRPFRAGQSVLFKAKRGARACIIRFRIRRENWCEWWRERFWMWRWTCAAVRRLSGNGMA